MRGPPGARAFSERTITREALSRGRSTAVGPVCSHNSRVMIRILGRDLPGRSCRPSPDSPGGYQNVHVGVQRRDRRDELLGLVRGDVELASWALECTAERSGAGFDVKGPYIQGARGERF